MRLSWGDEPKDREEWKKWKYWSYIENTKEQFEQEELVALITKEHMLSIPDQFGMAVDSKGKMWVVYRANDGDIWLASPNEELDDWVYHRRLIYVPSGSTNPTIVFDKQDRHIIGCEFLPAGAEQKEIWLYEPPYSGDGVRRIVDGQSPVLARDQRGVIHLFYQIPDQNEIRYRNGIDGFISEMLFPQSDLEYPYPAGFRTIMNQYESYLEYKYILFSNQVGNALPHYTMTNYTAVSKNDSSISAMASIGGLQWESYAFYVTIQLRDYFRKTPIEYAVIIFRGQQYVTDAGGKIDLGLIGAYPSDTILLQHEDYPDTTFEFQITEDTDYVFEVMGVLGATESLNASPVVTGIEWESMLTPAYVLVYSGRQTIYEQTYLLTYTNPTTTSVRESFVWESKGQISNQDVSVNIYTDGVKRPGIALRCTGSGGTENLYAGYYRHVSGNLEIAKYVNGTYTQLVVQSMAIQQGKWYSLRMQAEGSSIRLKIWDVEEPEPSNWVLQTTDTSISNGYAGLWDFDGSGTSKWSKFSLNGEEASWETASEDIPEGWSLQFGTASRWTTETESIAVGFDYSVVPGATVQFGGQTSQTNQNGLAPFYELRAGDLHEYEISHPDYEVINTGKLLIPEGTDIVLPVQMFHDPPNYPCEVVSANPEVSLVEWVDARYTVTIRVVSYETGTTMAGSSVVFAGETKITDENGEAVFHLVKPFPTVNLYEIQIDGFPVANVRVTGHESTREITILIQAGAETVPKVVADFAEMVPNITSILWVEVE